MKTPLSFDEHSKPGESDGSSAFAHGGSETRQSPRRPSPILTAALSLIGLLLLFIGVTSAVLAVVLPLDPSFGLGDSIVFLIVAALSLVSGGAVFRWWRERKVLSARPSVGYPSVSGERHQASAVSSGHADTPVVAHATGGASEAPDAGWASGTMDSGDSSDSTVAGGDFGGAASETSSTVTATGPRTVSPSSSKTPVPDPTPSLITRSDDIFATLRNFVEHVEEGRATSSTLDINLAAMLRRAGLMEWDDAPVARVAAIQRTKCYWVLGDPDEISPASYERMIAVETALALNDRLRHLEGAPARSADELDSLARGIVEGVMDAPCLFHDPRRACLEAGVPSLDVQPGPEWVVRDSLSSFAENIATPLRTVVDYRVNLAEGVAACVLTAHGPACFQAVSTCDDELGRVHDVSPLAARYAVGCAIRFARAAFVSSPEVRRVVVAGFERGADGASFVLELNRAKCSQLEIMARSGDDHLLDDASMTCERDVHGWFVPSGPSETEILSMGMNARQHMAVELIDDRASDDLHKHCGALRVADLGINENARRVDAWARVLKLATDELPASTSRPAPNAFEEATLTGGAALFAGTVLPAGETLTSRGFTNASLASAIAQARRESDDVTVIEACDRVSELLMQGAADDSSAAQLGNVFVNGSALDMVVNQAAVTDRTVDAILSGMPNPDGIDPEAAVRKSLATVEDALKPIDDLGIYLDDRECCYRYFGSLTERLAYNLAFHDESRRCELVPDSYFNGHYIGVRFSLRLGEVELALGHASALTRVAPVSADAAVMMTKVLEEQSRLYDSENLLKDALGYAYTTRDAALLHYRLGYIEWKLGQTQSAVACYKRSLRWKGAPSYGAARSELDQLLAHESSLTEPTDDEAVATLRAQGIEAGCDTDLTGRLLAAGMACVDEGLHVPALAYLGSLYQIRPSDYLMNVCRSLRA